MLPDSATIIALSKQGAPVLFLLAIVVLWRQLLAVQAKYEALVREMGATLAIIAKELDHDHEGK